MGPNAWVFLLHLPFIHFKEPTVQISIPSVLVSVTNSTSVLPVELRCERHTVFWLAKGSVVDSVVTIALGIMYWTNRNRLRKNSNLLAPNLSRRQPALTMRILQKLEQYISELRRSKQHKFSCRKSKSTFLIFAFACFGMHLMFGFLSWLWFLMKISKFISSISFKLFSDVAIPAQSETFKHLLDIDILEQPTINSINILFGRYCSWLTLHCLILFQDSIQTL